jgi:hypothetical protein
MDGRAFAYHISRHLTDGHVELALMVYDSEDDEEAELAHATTAKSARR